MAALNRGAIRVVAAKERGELLTVCPGSGTPTDWLTADTGRCHICHKSVRLLPNRDSQRHAWVGREAFDRRSASQ